MEISFDPAKRARNLAKHGLDLVDAGEVLGRRCLEVVDDRNDRGEERFLSVGLLGGVIVVCIWVERGGSARIISLRKANRNEQKEYLRFVFG